MYSFQELGMKHQFFNLIFLQMKKIFFRKAFWLITIFLAIELGSVAAQNVETKISADTTKTTRPKVGTTTNVMLNASSESGPRNVNIGLPASVGGTTILENGLPVTYDFMGQSPTAVWRQDAGIAKFAVLNVAETAILASDVGVSVSTFTNRGSDKFKGSAAFATNSYGLLRGDIGISGPLKNGFYYSLTAFIDMNPGTFRTNFASFLDKAQIYKGVLNKRYTNGQIALQYKFAYNEVISAKQSPYIYHQDGTVEKIPGFRIGNDSYLEQSGYLHVVNPLTGKQETWDAMKDLANTSHVFDIMGDHKFSNGIVLDYTLRYHYANSGIYNPYLTTIVRGIGKNNTPKAGSNRYFYADNPEAPYTGWVQNGMMIAAPSSMKNTLMARLELSKKSEKHHWLLGFHNWYYNTDKANMATYSYQFEAAPNPRALIYEQFDGTKWVKKTDEYGNRNYNAALQYYNGIDNKMALLGSEKWAVNDKLSVDIGTRLEWQHLDGDWYSANDRKAGGTNWVSGKTSSIQKDWFNITGTANATYKAFKNAGFIAEAMYIQQSGKLSMYAGADDPAIETCEIPGLALGFYFNHPLISLVSKVTKIKRTNFKNNSTFNKEVAPGVIETDKQTNGYDVNTIGWTTDILFTPFKGFNLHVLLTLQNPKYENYSFTTKWGDHYDFSGNVARSVSKTLIEIDPSYTWGKFNIWASVRYFSKEYANYPNTLVFAERWEAFAGLNFKYDKNIDFGISAVNLLNQSGAQGSISGTNTTTVDQAKALYDNPLCGTYIRPFTLEFKTKIRF
jgi:hypothetical protein